MEKKSIPLPLARAVLIAEDHEVARFGLSNFLLERKKIERVEGCETLPDAMEALGRSPFDLAIFDLDLPGMSDPLNPVELERVRRTYPDMKVVVMSGFDHRSYVLAALAAGVHGYIPKRFTLEQVAEKLGRIVAGEVYVPPCIAVLDGVPRSSKRTETGRDGAMLTARQLEVLDGISDGLTNKEIGKRLKLTESTIKLHASGLFQQLGVKSRSQAAMAGQKFLKSKRPQR